MSYHIVIDGNAFYEVDDNCPMGCEEMNSKLVKMPVIEKVNEKKTFVEEIDTEKIN